MTEGNTLLNAVVGGVVSVVFVFVPFSPVLGGAVAGYLERRQGREAAVVGALSGLVAAIPLLLFALLGGAFFLAVPFVGAHRTGAAIAVGALVFGFAFLALYTVGLGTVGGLLGGYLAGELG